MTRLLRSPDLLRGLSYVAVHVLDWPVFIAPGACGIMGPLHFCFFTVDPEEQVYDLGRAFRLPHV